MRYKHTNIPVKKETKKELGKRKFNKQARKGQHITWDKFLLEATEEDKHGT